jgi:glycosyltransferase involved in cell wall biosynthesis
VLEFLRKSQALLLPVEFPEPFGLAAIEAMSCGCPVIAYNQGAYRETISHGKTGFLASNYEEIITALNNVELINREYCQSHVRKNFSVEKMVNNYITLYEQVGRDIKKTSYDSSLTSNPNQLLFSQ